MTIKLLSLAAVVVFSLQLSTPTVHAATTLVVPTQFPTIQSAVNAASAGDMVIVHPGTYVEQVVVAKDLTLKGAGAGATMIQAPPTLVPTGFVDFQGHPITAILHVTDGARVSMSGFTVMGPVLGICDPQNPSQRLSRAGGIRVTRSARLDLRDSHVTHIRDNPLGLCASGVGINIGLHSTPTPQVGFATIKNVAVDDYEFDGIGVSTSPTTAVVLDSRITGQGDSQLTDHNGIVVVGGAVLIAKGNTISGHLCDVLDFCGPDLVNQTQMGGIVTLPAGKGSVISDNTLFDNDSGIDVGESVDCCIVSGNTVMNNRYLGIGLFDGRFTTSENAITGGNVGVFIGAFASNTSAVLSGDQITGTLVAPIQTFQCCGFTATYTVVDE